MSRKSTKLNKLPNKFGDLSQSMVGYHNHIDFRFFDDFDDEDFAFLMKNISGVNMLDLNETAITDESIKLLLDLEYINELRVKECRNLTDDCTEILNKLTTLVFLHLKNTEITIDGLLKLKNLTNLKTLLFSADDPTNIKEKLINLKIMLLQCEIIINSKRYYFNAIELFIYFLKNKPYLYQLKIKNENISTEWSNWLIQPNEDSIEAEFQGAYAINSIEWIEIKPLTFNVITEESDYFAELIILLKYLEFPFMINNGIMSLYILENEI